MNVIEHYIRDVLEGGQRKKGTILSALDTFKNFNAWREEAEKGEPETLTRADLREFKAWMLARMPSNTARKHWTRVHALYRYLVDEDVIVKAPTHGIEPPVLTHKAPRVWSMDDLRAMLAKCKDEVDRLTFYAFALTGMRDGEVRKLSWKPAPDHETDTRAYVDFNADALVITGAKGGKSRNVPLHPMLRAELEKRWKHVVTYGFLSREWVYEDYNHSRRVMDRLMKAASSDGSRHVFRKTALTWMDRHGVRDIVAKAIVGHAAQGVTQVHYLSVDDAEKVAAIRGLYAGELDSTEAPALSTVVHRNGNGGLDASGLTPAPARCGRGADSGVPREGGSGGMTHLWRETTKHYEGIYGAPPLPRCQCVLCNHARQVRAYCRACHNGGGVEGCWTCGRGTFWTEQEFTKDVVLGA